MIVDEHVFTDTYLPDRLLHRDAAINGLANAFEPAVAGGRDKIARLSRYDIRLLIYTIKYT